MADISTAIELYDRVSAPAYNMVAALSKVCTTFEFVELSINKGFDTSAIIQAGRVIEQTETQVIELGNEIESNEAKQESFNEAAQSGSSKLESFGNLLKNVASKYINLENLKKVLDISDELARTTAKLDMMNQAFNKSNNTAYQTDELVNKVYKSAQNSRISFNDMAAAVESLGNKAGEAFGSQEEVVAFANLIQKQMTIAGASAQESSGAMQQLSQALDDGVLSSSELNSIFGQAPNMIQTIADYLDVPISKIQEMADRGELSADVFKTAIFGSADAINEKFSQMPMTWDQVFTSIQNGILMQFQPVLNKINDLANNPAVQLFSDNAVGALAAVADMVFVLLDVIGKVGSFVADNWSIIGPIIYGIAAAIGVVYGAMVAYNAVTKISTAIEAAKALASSIHSASLAMQTGATFSATAAQYGLNTALLACPLTWIVIAIIAVIAAVYAVIAIINKVKGTTISATGIIAGAFMLLWARIMNNFIVPMQNKFAILVNFIGNVFNDPIAAIQIAFCDMSITVIGYIKNLAQAIETLLNQIPGVTVDITSGLDGFYSNLKKVQKFIKDESGWVEYVKQWDYISYEDAYKKGYNFGTNLDSKLSSMFKAKDIDTGLNFDDLAAGYNSDYESLGNNVSDISSNTGSIAESLEITSEDLKYLRDIAEKEAVNRFTTAEIRVEMTNNNSISSDMDLDGIVDYLAVGVNTAMEKAAEGVHV